MHQEAEMVEALRVQNHGSIKRLIYKRVVLKASPLGEMYVYIVHCIAVPPQHNDAQHEKNMNQVSVDTNQPLVLELLNSIMQQQFKASLTACNSKVLLQGCNLKGMHVHHNIPRRFICSFPPLPFGRKENELSKSKKLLDETPAFCFHIKKQTHVIYAFQALEKSRNYLGSM
jgi:hypothetical protein